MSREEVEANQTARILAAMNELVAEHGYERTTVDRVTRRSGVSRRTFYELHGGRDQWFLVTCKAAAARLLERIEAANGNAERHGPAGHQAASALIDFCLDDPAGARICFVETLAANDEARAWRAALVDQVTAVIATAEGATRSDLPARAAVGAVLELVGRRPEQLDRAYAVALVTALLAAGEGGDTGR